jgi:hypothetical protein
LPDLAKKYTKQLVESDNKPFVLSRMIAEFCKIALPLQLVRKLYNLYGEYTVYNAVFPTSNWVEREHIRSQDSLYRYLYAVCRNLKAEEVDEDNQQQVIEQRSQAAAQVRNEIREIYARKRVTVGQ